MLVNFIEINKDNHKFYIGNYYIHRYMKDLDDIKLRECFEEIYNKTNTRKNYILNDMTLELYSLKYKIKKIGPIKMENIISDDFKKKDTEEYLLDPNIIGGTTSLICGSSFTGKTSFLMKGLKNLINDYLPRYDAIILMTESPNSLPLTDLPNNPKIMKFGCFIPELVDFCYRINRKTNNKFSFLFIFDDIMDLRGKLMTKMIITYRNANISTIILTQHQFLLNPAQRSSFHNIYCTGGREFNQREKLIKNFFRGYLIDRGYKDIHEQDRFFQQATQMNDDERNYIHMNGIQSKMTINKMKKY